MGLFCFSRSQTIFPARRIYQSRNEADFKIDVDIECCVHGYLAKDKKQPASLIIFTPQLVCVDKGTFNLFRMEVDFHDQGGSSKPCKPVIISTAPFSVQERVHEEVVGFRKKTTQSAKKAARMTVTAGLGDTSLKAGIGGELGSETQNTQELEYSYKIHYFCKGSSNTRCDDFGVPRGVWWNVKKSSNPETKDDAGIPPNYRFAVLLTRANDSTPFEASIRLSVEAGWAHRKEKIIDMFTRVMPNKGGNKKERPSSAKRISQELINLVRGDYEGEPRPTAFDPRTEVEGDCRGIDRFQLGKYFKEGELAKLTAMPKS